jgi:hypothetical protein
MCLTLYTAVPKYALMYRRNSGSTHQPRQLPPHEHLDEVGEVVGRAEGDPGYVGVRDEGTRPDDIGRTPAASRRTDYGVWWCTRGSNSRKLHGEGKHELTPGDGEPSLPRPVAQLFASPAPSGLLCPSSSHLLAAMLVLFFLDRRCACAWSWEEEAASRRGVQLGGEEDGC